MAIHAVIRKLLDRTYRLKPLILCTIVLTMLHLPPYIYLRYFGQLTKTDYAQTFLSYLMDINYDAYLKIAVITFLIAAALKKKTPRYPEFFSISSVVSLAHNSCHGNKSPVSLFQRSSFPIYEHCVSAWFSCHIRGVEIYDSNTLEEVFVEE